MKFSEFSAAAIPKLELQMESIISLSKQDWDDSLLGMLRYHLGWGENDHAKSSKGKRIRPLILLLATETAGGDWENALPAAASIELIHNFSLIHDDIEDKSAYRRGRQTLWKLHDLPLAINAGDAMYALSFISLGELIKTHSSEIAFQAYKLISHACLALTKGQHLDISFEKAGKISVQQYLEMIKGKTAALLAISTKLGSLLANADQQTQEYYYELGKNIGLAFQIHDDILGIWGNPEETGKSTSTDLIARKKSLPILFGLAQNGEFSKLWEENISPENVSILANQLKQEGAYDFALKKADQYIEAGINALEMAKPTGPAAEALQELVYALTRRNK